MKRLSLVLACVSLAAVLAIGLPLFLRTPVWVDVTYHDLSAWNILHGGVHYKDVFETNLPGMVWLHALVRPVVGWSHEAIRAVDLLVFASVLALLVRLMRGRAACLPSPPGFAGGEGPGVRGGTLAASSTSLPTQEAEPPSPPSPLPPQSRGERGDGGLPVSAFVWFVVAASLFYLFETEFIHCQRDGWMLLPALGAMSLRAAAVRGRRNSRRSIAEGLLWGFAVWIKPHVLVPALLVWLVSLRFQPWRAALRDALGVLVGGLVAGVAGSAWLIRTGAWGPMWDVLLNWNQDYYHWSWSNLWFKVRIVSAYFGPFSILHFAAVPLGVLAICRRDPNRAILAALYLGWLAQATIIQKEFDYAHYPPTLLGLALLAMHRWPVGPVFLGWCVAAGLVNELAPDAPWLRELERLHPPAARTLVPPHPIARSDRLALWGRCWTDGSWELKDRLTFYHDLHCAPDWADLQHVADFLATQHLKDRELICWHDSTHPLYVWLGVRPAIRYPHVITAMKFKSKRDQIRREAFESPARFVVSDLVPAMYLVPPGPPAPPPGPASELPVGFPSWGADVYPWNQPVVYRAGRYIVHRVESPRGEIDFPLPPGLWEDSAEH